MSRIRRAAGEKEIREKDLIKCAVMNRSTSEKSIRNVFIKKE